MPLNAAAETKEMQYSPTKHALFESVSKAYLGTGSGFTKYKKVASVNNCNN